MDFDCTNNKRGLDLIYLKPDKLLKINIEIVSSAC